MLYICLTYSLRQKFTCPQSECFSKFEYAKIIPRNNSLLQRLQKGVRSSPFYIKTKKRIVSMIPRPVSASPRLLFPVPNLNIKKEDTTRNRSKIP